MEKPRIKVKDFRIKGIGDVLLVKMDDGSWEQELEALLAYIESRKDFFTGAKIAIEVGERKVKAVQMADLRDGLAEQQVNLVALFSKSKQTITTARTFGLETEPEKIRSTVNAKSKETLYGGEDAVLYAHTLRSGMKVSHQSSVVVLGDVNPGAEIISDGSVLVWGSVRGQITAGAQGNDQAVICAMEMKASRVQIAGTEGNKNMQHSKPVKINCQNSELVITNWKH